MPQCQQKRKMRQVRHRGTINKEIARLKLQIYNITNSLDSVCEKMEISHPISNMFIFDVPPTQSNNCIKAYYKQIIVSYALITDMHTNSDLLKSIFISGLDKKYKPIILRYGKMSLDEFVKKLPEAEEIL